jgi:CheY-like chemotaxis protein
MYDPFFTTKDKTHGTGMGLSVVHGIVRSYRGAMSAYSEPGEGSVFSVYLPAPENKFESSKVVEEPIPEGSEHILFVDDEKTLVKLAETMLTKLGYTVTDTTDSTEALHLFRKDPERYDLVITDLTMPKMTGDELARRMLSIRSGIPIILCTGFSSLVTEETAQRMGISTLLTKPLSLREIGVKVRQVLDAHLNQ